MLQRSDQMFGQKICDCIQNDGAFGMLGDIMSAEFGVVVFDAVCKDPPVINIAL